MKTKLLLKLFTLSLSILTIVPNAKALGTVTGKRLYDHHSSKITGGYWGYYANGIQSAYDFVAHSYQNSTSTANTANKDMVEHQGPFGGGFAFTETSGASTIWNGAIYGNGTTKYVIAPSTFNYNTASTNSDIINAYNSNSSSATTSMSNMKTGNIYLARIRNSDYYVAIKINTTHTPTNQQIINYSNGATFYEDVYFDFDYKYTTVITDIYDTYLNPLSLSVFPNPATESITVSIKNIPAGKYQLQIVNSIGEQVYAQQLEAINEQINESVYFETMFAKGVYALVLKNKEGEQLGVVGFLKQ